MPLGSLAPHSTVSSESWPVPCVFQNFQGSIRIRRLVIWQPSEASDLNTCFPLHLGSTKPLSSGDLRAVTNDADSTGNRTVTFTVISSPRLGRLVRVNSDNSTEDVSVFTQTLVSPDVRESGQGWGAVEGSPRLAFILSGQAHEPLSPGSSSCAAFQTRHRMTPLSETLSKSKLCV